MGERLPPAHLGEPHRPPAALFQLLYRVAYLRGRLVLEVEGVDPERAEIRPSSSCIEISQILDIKCNGGPSRRVQLLESLAELGDELGDALPRPACSGSTCPPASPAPGPPAAARPCTPTPSTGPARPWPGCGSHRPRPRPGPRSPRTARSAAPARAATPAAAAAPGWPAPSGRRPGRHPGRSQRQHRTWVRSIGRCRCRWTSAVGGLQRSRSPGSSPADTSSTPPR